MTVDTNDASLNVEGYLAIEADSSVRHEYRYGLVYAMAGSSDLHDLIGLALLSTLRSGLKGKGCYVHLGNVKVSCHDRCFYYSDAFVTCDPRDRDDRYIKRYPSFIAEVLSPSTEKFDRGEKFSDYQQLETLDTYWLISQDRIQVEVRQKTATGDWETRIYNQSDRVVIPALGITIAIADLYEDVDLAQP